ncbi:MAG: DUF5814 domain-containing protein [Methanoculleaceae archaeon]
MITRKATFRAAKRLQKAAGFRISDRVFSGPFLEAIVSAVDYDRLDRRLKEQILQIYRDFLSCTCKDAPFCGCPERKFVMMLIDLRERGLDHHQISEYLLDVYGIDLYAADILSFLESSVHWLEAIRDVADLEGEEMVKDAAERHIREIEG